MKFTIKPEHYRILIVDDEETARLSLAEILRLEGYQVEVAGDGDTAISVLEQHIYQAIPFDLLLLDLKMPGTDGLDILHFIAQTKPTPTDPNRPAIILLTAHGSLESAIEALRFGAHDYLLKPSSPEQIIRSINSALEQRDTHDQSSNSTGSQIYALTGDVWIDLLRREITFKDFTEGTQTIKLTPTEAKLMQVFFEHPQVVFTHSQLVAQVQGYEIKEWEAAEVLRPLVSRLRRKLSQVPGGRDWIVSIRGTGYVLELKIPLASQGARPHL